MLKTISLSALAATAALSLMTPAHAQITIQTGPQQAQNPYSPLGDRDRDGVPNAFDNNNNPYYNDNHQGRGDQDHDGIANKYDTDRDGDGRLNQYDRSPANPHR